MNSLSKNPAREKSSSDSPAVGLSPSRNVTKSTAVASSPTAKGKKAARAVATGKKAFILKQSRDTCRDTCVKFPDLEIDREGKKDEMC